LVQEAHVVRERELSLQTDELPDAVPLALAVRGGRGEAVAPVDAGVAPLPAHLAAQVAEVRHAELYERGRRDFVRGGIGEMPQHGPPAAPHAAEVPAREPCELEPPLEAHEFDYRARMARNAAASLGPFVRGPLPRGGFVRRRLARALRRLHGARAE